MENTHRVARLLVPVGDIIEREPPFSLTQLQGLLQSVTRIL